LRPFALALRTGVSIPSFITARVDEQALNSQICRIPWMASGTTLVEYLLLTTEHLSNHRMQLFLYLRLLGSKLDTSNFYGG
jgi:hypothetical protein